MGQTKNSVTIHADIEQVWSITNDLTLWTRLFTEYSEVEILNQQDGTWRFRLTMHPDQSGTAWSWVSERTLDKSNFRVTARRIEPGWFEFMNITWTYEEGVGGTKMTWIQDFQMRSDSPVDDATMTNRINRNTTIQMAHIREHVEEVAAFA